MKNPYRIRVLSGSHREAGVTYRAGQVFQSQRAWHILMAERFELASAAADKAKALAADAAEVAAAERASGGGTSAPGDEGDAGQADTPPDGGADAGQADAGEADDQSDGPKPIVWEKTHRGGGYWDVHDDKGIVHPDGHGLKRAAADGLIKKLNDVSE